MAETEKEGLRLRLPHRLFDCRGQSKRQTSLTQVEDSPALRQHHIAGVVIEISEFLTRILTAAQRQFALAEIGGS